MPTSPPNCRAMGRGTAHIWQPVHINITTFILNVMLSGIYREVDGRMMCAIPIDEPAASEGQWVRCVNADGTYAVAVIKDKAGCKRAVRIRGGESMFRCYDIERATQDGARPAGYEVLAVMSEDENNIDVHALAADDGTTYKTGDIVHVSKGHTGTDENILNIADYTLGRQKGMHMFEAGEMMHWDGQSLRQGQRQGATWACIGQTARGSSIYGVHAPGSHTGDRVRVTGRDGRTKTVFLAGPVKGHADVYEYTGA